MADEMLSALVDTRIIYMVNILAGLSNTSRSEIVRRALSAYLAENLGELFDVIDIPSQSDRIAVEP